MYFNFGCCLVFLKKLKCCNRIKNLRNSLIIIIKKKKKKHDKIVLLAKTKLNSIEILISKALINSNTSQAEFVLINNVLKEFDDMKEEIKNLDLNSSSKILIYLQNNFILKCKISNITCYSVQANICKRLYGFLSFEKNMDKNNGKNISKKLSGKYSQNILTRLKNLQQMHLKLL